MCIFVVDADQSARKGLARLLRAASYDVREYASLPDFLETLDSGANGCLLLDLGMQELPCEELQEELKIRDLHFPIIMIAADDDPATRRKALQMNAAGFFHKPIDGTALLDAIAWALRSNSPAGQPN